jgi:cytochrome c-type biogenesis protein CcmH/NrfG
LKTQEAEHLAAGASAALSAGRLDDAISAYRAALALSPTVPDMWFNLGYALRASRQFDDALRAYGQALAHGVSQPEEALVNCAVILSEHLGRPIDARENLNAAIAANPAFVPALLNLGALEEDEGNLESALDVYRQVCRIAPHNGRALSRIASIETYAGRANAILPQLASALRDPKLQKDDAIDVAFAFGNALDASGQYTEAFKIIEAANRADYAQQSKFQRYDQKAQEKLIKALCKGSLPEPISVAADDISPVFICGMFRSGSTLAEQVLGRHSAVQAGGELDFIPWLVADHVHPYPAALESASCATLTEWREYYRSALRSSGLAGNLMTTDKRCDNFMHIGLIKSLFPNARIIHTTRHPLDTILSVFFLRFGPAVPYGVNLADIVHWYQQYQRVMAHWRGLYGSDIHDLDYDQLVTDPGAAIMSVCGFLGLSFEPGMISQPGGETIRTPSAWQVRQPIHARSSGRWHNYADQLETVRMKLSQGF